MNQAIKGNYNKDTPIYTVDKILPVEVLETTWMEYVCAYSDSSEYKIVGNNLCIDRGKYREPEVLEECDTHQEAVNMLFVLNREIALNNPAAPAVFMDFKDAMAFVAFSVEAAREIVEAKKVNGDYNDA